jgi:hypothetical protein
MAHFKFSSHGFGALLLFAFTNCLALGLSAVPPAKGAMFDFDNAPLHSPLPIDLMVDGITAHFSATGQGYSIQQANALGFTPAGFSGSCIYPSSVFAADLLVGFSAPLSDFSIMYSPEEYGSDASALMRVTAYMDAALVGTNTTTAVPPGTWPTGTLSFSSAQVFNRVVIQWAGAPSGTENWGPIFMADNMNVTPIPEPSAFVLLGMGAISVLGCTLRRRAIRSLRCRVPSFWLSARGNEE